MMGFVLLSAALLAAPPAAVDAPSPERAAAAALEEKLNVPPPAWPAFEAAADGGAFAAALHALGRAAGVPTVLDRPAVAAAGFDAAALPFAPPPADLPAPATLRGAFGVLLAAQAGPDLTLENRGGVLLVTTLAATAERLETRVYPLADLAPDETGNGPLAGPVRVTQRVAGAGRAGGRVVGAGRSAAGRRPAPHRRRAGRGEVGRRRRPRRGGPVAHDAGAGAGGAAVRRRARRRGRHARRAAGGRARAGRGGAGTMTRFPTPPPLGPP